MTRSAKRGVIRSDTVLCPQESGTAKEDQGAHQASIESVEAGRLNVEQAGKTMGQIGSRSAGQQHRQREQQCRAEQATSIEHVAQSVAHLGEDHMAEPGARRAEPGCRGKAQTLGRPARGGGVDVPARLGLSQGRPW
ncbi:hypothetical protein GCM10023165_50350 [Variovorax defluvii]|uniref:Uncharacterized protein n=1 Tax=Variovorax defluvii TaxID=913761 RepID=A0ABP8IDZ5_9BURK